MTVKRPVPRLTEENRFFWTSGADGRLRFMRCNDCETTIHPPYPVCRNCLSENVSPQAVPGTGEIYSVTVNYQMDGDHQQDSYSAFVDNFTLNYW